MMGHEVEVYSIYNGNAELFFHEKKRVKSLNRNSGRRLVDYNGWYKLSLIINEFKPDIIQANAADTLKYAVISKILFKWKSPLVYRNASVFSFYAISRSSKVLNRFFLKNVDKIISVSEASKNDLNKLFPFTRTKSTVVPVGIEKKMDLSNTEPIAFKRKINIIHIGSFTREKNHLGILKIFKKVHLEVPDIDLHLLGDGPLKQEIKDKALELGLNEIVHFHGEIQDPYPYLLSSDVLVLPSIIEGLPGVILEAMYSKVPVVAYDIGGVNEVVNNSTGELVQKGDEDAFVNAVIKSLRNRSIEQVENAYNNVTGNFINSKIAERFARIYKEILHN